MDKTKVSDKYQVVIPKTVRNRLKLKIGQTLHVYAVERGGILLSLEKNGPKTI